MKSLRRELSIRNLVLVVVAVILNVGIGQLVHNFRIPVYLDTIGTVLAGVLAGPWTAALVGYISSFTWTVTGLFPEAIIFSGVAMVIGLLSVVFYRAGWFSDGWRAALAGLISGCIAAMMSTPIIAFLGGAVANSGTEAIAGMLSLIGLGDLLSIFFQTLLSDPLDKAVTFLIVWAILRILPQWLKAQFAPRRKES